MSVEFIGNTNVQHIESDEANFDSMLRAVSGASIAETSGITGGEREIPLAGSLVIAEKLHEIPDAQAMMRTMDEQFVAGKAVAMFCKNGRPANQAHDSRWRLFTGYYLLDGEPSEAIHTIDPRHEAPGHVRRSAIMESMGHASEILAYTLSTVEE